MTNTIYKQRGIIRNHD